MNEEIIIDKIKAILTDRNVLILAFYTIVVAYVIYRALNSLKNESTIQINQESLDAQLREQNLQERIGLKFGVPRECLIDQVREIGIDIENKSQRDTLYVYWDQSSMTDLYGRSRRIIRIIPGMTLDLFQSQVDSVIAAGKTLRERITAEDVLKRQGEDGALKIDAPLFDLSRLKKGSSTDKKRYAEFLNQSLTFQFSIRLVLRVFDPATQMGSAVPYSVSCDFTIKKQPWTEAVRWKAK